MTRATRPEPSNSAFVKRYGMPWTTEQRDELLRKWLNNDAQAIDFILRMGEVSECWDDLIDKDNPVPDQRIDENFTFLIAEAHIHPFYLRHPDAIHSLMMLTVIGYLDSEALKKRGESKEDYIHAFAMRYQFIELLIFATMVTSGFKAAREYSMEIRDFFYHDSFDDWSGEGANNAN